MAVVDLKVSGLAGDTTSISTDAGATVAQVKSQLRKSLGVHVRDQRLLVGARELEDHEILGESLKAAGCDATGGSPVNATLVRCKGLQPSDLTLSRDTECIYGGHTRYFLVVKHVPSGSTLYHEYCDSHMVTDEATRLGIEEDEDGNLSVVWEWSENIFGTGLAPMNSALIDAHVDATAGALGAFFSRPLAPKKGGGLMWVGKTVRQAKTEETIKAMRAKRAKAAAHSAPKQSDPAACVGPLPSAAPAPEARVPAVAGGGTPAPPVDPVEMPALIDTLVGFTGASPRTAAAALRSHAYRVEDASSYILLG